MPQPLGVIRPMKKHSPLNLRAQCQRHKDCKLWLSPSPQIATKDTILRELASWLAKADILSEDKHQEAAERVKAQYKKKKDDAVTPAPTSTPKAAPTSVPKRGWKDSEQPVLASSVGAKRPRRSSRSSGV